MTKRVLRSGGLVEGTAMQIELALPTFRGKPIAYASIAGTPRARLFTSIDCRED